METKNIMGRTLPVDPYLPLKYFNWSRPAYASSLYGTGDGCDYLLTAMRSARVSFLPDIAITTSQNAYFDKIFHDIPRLYLEQAPLPRFLQPFRTAFDPQGHQTNSFIDNRANDICNLSLPPYAETALDETIVRLEQELLRSPQAASGIDFIRASQKKAKVAILATQPPNWITYEGSYKDIDLEGLLCEWEEQLPPGWIGVPTFHAGYRLPSSLEQHLMSSGRRLQFLPETAAQGVSEPLVAAADALISISSTTSITALLLGKPAIVVGKSPFNAWCGNVISELNEIRPVERTHAKKLLATVCHILSLTTQQISRRPEVLRNLLKARLTDGGSGDWQLDFTTWTPQSLKDHFPSLWRDA
jgi:hypothetical protein